MFTLDLIPVVFHWLSNPVRPPVGTIDGKGNTDFRKSSYTRSTHMMLSKIWHLLISPRVWFLSYLFCRWLLNEIRQRQKIFAFQERDCLHTIQVALYVTENIRDLKRIEKRTLFEKRLSDVVLDDGARRWIVNAARQTTEEEPCLMIFIPPRHRWHILNLVQNQVSAVDGTNYIYFDQRTTEQRVHLKSAWYIFTLICHRSPGRGRYLITPSTKIQAEEDVPILKIRAALVHEKVIQRIVKGEFKPPAKFFSDRHLGRWRILCKIANLYSHQFPGGDVGFDQTYSQSTLSDDENSRNILLDDKDEAEDKFRTISQNFVSSDRSKDDRATQREATLTKSTGDLTLLTEYQDTIERVGSHRRHFNEAVHRSLRRTNSIMHDLHRNPDFLNDEGSRNSDPGFVTSKAVHSYSAPCPEFYAYSNLAIDPAQCPPGVSVQFFRDLGGVQYFESIALWLEAGGPLRPILKMITRILLRSGIWDTFPHQGGHILAADATCESFSTMSGETIGCWDKTRETSGTCKKDLGHEGGSSANTKIMLDKINTCCRVHMPFPTLKTKVDSEEMQEMRQDEEFVLFRIGGD